MRRFVRAASGKFIVPIPIKPNARELGESRSRAVRTLYSMEAKFRRDPVFHREYVSFIDNFINKGILSIIDKIDNSKPYFFLPHHGLMPKRKKFRAVFNGSATTSTGESFNSIQMNGEKLQDNLCDILLRFRLHRFALAADIEQMYPQVLIKPEFRQMQLVLWRKSPNDPIKTYCINTVMFGMQHALHSAVRSMRQCALEGTQLFPEASKVALRDFYVDDLITGADTEDMAINLQRQMKNLMSTGGFPIKKWSANNWTVISAIDNEDLKGGKPINFDEVDSQSVLGVTWNPSTDHFHFVVDDSQWTEHATKRTVASDIAKLFDPIGLLIPVITWGKVFIRELWIGGIDWDTKLPEVLRKRWIAFRAQLKNVERISIPRWIGTSKDISFELHGFADASTTSYAATIYHKVISEEGMIRCGLFTAKSRAAPIKPVSIPRLELSAALLTAELMENVLRAMGDRCSSH